MQSRLRNRTIFCADNLDVLRGINTRSIDLIYIDPPFNKKKVFSAPKGSPAEGASFRDIFRAEETSTEVLSSIQAHQPILSQYLRGIQQIGHSSNYAYLCYMSTRLIEIHRILKDTGSLYLHCDPSMSAYLRLLLDCIFGEEHFRNEIIWWYRKFGHASKNFKKNHDILLYYSKNHPQVFFNPLFEDFSPNTQIDKYKRILKKGRWIQDKSTPMSSIRKQQGVAMSNTWEIPFLHSQSKERLGYPTQKPLALLNRIIKASSRRGELVLDPFCGCATTCISAERLERQWIGIDLSPQTFDLAKLRLNKEVESLHQSFSSPLYFRTDIPQRTDIPR